MIRTYKRKLILTKAQEQRVISWLGVCRLVYNMGLEIKSATYKCNKTNVHKYELQKQITAIRSEYDWIMDVPYESLTDVTERLDNSFKRFFKTHKKGGGYPKFASKKTFKSIRFKQGSVKNGIINVPKLGSVRIFKDEPIIGDLKNIYIKKEPTGFFICLQCENVPSRFESENQAIGLDMGLSHFCVDSNGNFIANPKHFKKYERRLRIENRSLARKKKGSKGWLNQAKRLSILHHKIGNARRDFLHKESTKIAKANATVYMEDLNISGMSKNRNLAKHILDAGWGAFKTMLQYKTTVILVNPKYTSQACHECGTVDSVSRVSQSEYKCISCGHQANADVNAAQNIKSKGIALGR